MQISAHLWFLSLQSGSLRFRLGFDQCDAAIPGGENLAGHALDISGRHGFDLLDLPE
jgi:hypothetical protein